MTLKALASGTLVEVDEKGRASFPTCTWLVRVATNHPEPDSFADTFRDVECGARLVAIEGLSLDDGHTCEAGHDHLSYEYYCRSGAEYEDAQREYLDEIGPHNSLSHVF